MASGRTARTPWRQQQRRLDVMKAAAQLPIWALLALVVVPASCMRCLAEFCNCSARIFSDATCTVWPIVRTDNGTTGVAPYALFISRFDNVIELEGQAFAPKTAHFPTTSAPLVESIYVVNNPVLRRIKSGAFLGLEQAVSLRIEDNRRLDYVDRCALPGDSFNLSEIYLSGLPELKYLRFLTNVYLGQLERILITDSGIEYIVDGSFQQKPKLREIVLTGTRLHTIDICVFKPYFDLVNEGKQLLVSGRTFKCDCDMYYLRGVLSDTGGNASTAILRTSEAMCAEPASQRGKSIYAYGMTASRKCLSGGGGGASCRIVRTAPCVFSVGSPTYSGQKQCYGKKCAANEFCYHGRCLATCGGGDGGNVTCLDEDATCIGSMCVCQTGKFLEGGASCSKSRGEKALLIACIDDDDCSYPYTCHSERCIVTCHQGSDCAANGSLCVANMCACVRPTLVLIHPCPLDATAQPTDGLVAQWHAEGGGESVWVYAIAGLACVIVVSVAVAVSCRRRGSNDQSAASGHGTGAAAAAVAAPSEAAGGDGSRRRAASSTGSSPATTAASTAAAIRAYAASSRGGIGGATLDAASAEASAAASASAAVSAAVAAARAAMRSGTPRACSQAATAASASTASSSLSGSSSTSTSNLSDTAQKSGGGGRAGARSAAGKERSLRVPPPPPLASSNRGARRVAAGTAR